MALWLSGCTHLHDAEKAALAKTTVEEFQKFQTNTAQVYKAMSDNLQKSVTKTAQRRKEMTQAWELAFANTVHAKTWQIILDELENLEKQEAQIAKSVNEQVQAFLEKQRKAATENNGTTVAERKDYAWLRKVVDDQNWWAARKALLRESLQLADEKLAAKYPKLDPNKKTRSLQEVLEKQEVTTLAVGENGQLSPQEEKVGEVLKGELPQPEQVNLPVVVDTYTTGKFDPYKDPGLTVAILSLAVDLADAKLQKARLEASYISQRIGALKYLKENYKFLKNSKEWIEDLINKGFILRKETVLTTLNRLRDRGQERNLTTAIEALYFYGITKVTDQSQQDQREVLPYILDHAYSINLSALNGREHEALISRGLQGLQMYHEGGVKQEDIANFLRAAQTVALAVISAQGK
ncbi:MAG: hypothetical protein A2Y80_05530 [Deltaproteobacteria bacterium RBG_13_58_19]|nr:MAG: hypothetical protein A2Y80_05530 [Deltaproteobacteria bacterium RBG_13_58_19]